MKTAKSVALLAEGKLTDSPLARFWSLSQMLGPVQASSYRLASRIANRLRAGYAVQDYDGFDACRTVLISVPDHSLPRVLAKLCSAEISWPGKAVILSSSALDSGELREFSARRASVASISTIPGFEDLRYLVEGDKPAVRAAKRLVEHGDRRAVAIERGLKPFYQAALTCTGSLLFALLLAASESLRHAGVEAPVSAAILERQIGKSLRSYLRAGRRGYQPPVQLSRQLHTLSHADPPLATYVEQSCRLAARLFEVR
jgi:predicted short-subunit dehydrogenase-like oxidoreductase (DUF2520 family)